MQTNVQPHVKQLNIIYLALIAGQIFLAGVFVYLKIGEEATMASSGSIFIYIAPAIALGSIMLAFLVRDRQKAKVALRGMNDQEKAEHHRKSSIIQWALLEAGNLCMLIFFLLEGNYIFLLLFAVGMVAFTFLRPQNG